MTAQTIMVTGASGVVGSALLRALEGRGQRVIALVHHKPVEAESIRGDITRPWLGLDPRDYRDLAPRVDVVVHCAASVNFGAAAKTLHKLNVGGVGQVLRFVSDAGARLVHASTSYVKHAGDDTVALGAYASSKSRGEALVRESGLPTATARISTVIGDCATGNIARLQAFHHILGAAMEHPNVIYLSEPVLRPTCGRPEQAAPRARFGGHGDVRSACTVTLLRLRSTGRYRHIGWRPRVGSARRQRGTSGRWIGTCRAALALFPRVRSR
jgi:nucleoside-diphosphate-sugar epimerase